MARVGGQARKYFVCNNLHTSMGFIGTKIVQFLKTRLNKEVKPQEKRLGKKEERSLCFLENGSALLEELLLSCNGKCNTIRSFSAKELIKATDGFSHHLIDAGIAYMYKGSFENRPIIIKMFSDSLSFYAIRDIVIASQMSNHKNVLKLLGCCLEFKSPALVYEYTGHKLLSDLVYNKKRSFPWKSRLRIARDIASATVYLHTALSTSIIYRVLKPSNVIVDQYGIAKLFDFSFSISIPPGELQVEDDVVGTYAFAEPDYVATGIVTSKTDVYSFGVFLLVLLTGRRPALWDHENNRPHIVKYVNDCVQKDRFNKIVDRRILRKGGGIEQEQQLQAFLALALRCLQVKREDRPEMIDVAKELRRIEKPLLHPC